jgi:hypothetical protein
MNAQTKIVADGLLEGWSDTQRAYAETIAVFCPDACGAEMLYRVEIAAIRDQSAAGAARASEHAAAILSEVCRMATPAVYAAAPVSRLMRLRATLNFLMEAARAVERLSRDG